MAEDSREGQMGTFACLHISFFRRRLKLFTAGAFKTGGKARLFSHNKLSCRKKTTNNPFGVGFTSTVRRNKWDICRQAFFILFFANTAVSKTCKNSNIILALLIKLLSPHTKVIYLLHFLNVINWLC